MLAMSDGSGHASSPREQSRAAKADVRRVNTVVVIVDDMRAQELEFLPRTRHWLARDGVRFDAAYAPTPLCCPARATLLTGQYAHNTGVFDNDEGGSRPGGLHAFDDDRTLATVLQAKGVKTGYVGKYLHGYHHRWVPPGWNDWRGAIDGAYQYRNADGHRTTARGSAERYAGETTYNIDGRVRTIKGYETTVQTRLATRFIQRRADSPFYLQLNYLAPHGTVGGRDGSGPPVPHQSHRHDFDGLRAPRTDAYNERDVSDKVRAARRPSLTRRKKAVIDHTAEARAETLQSVDDGMRAIRRVLHREGIVQRTNVVFVSDNGFTLGEHRIHHTKVWGYEPSAMVPLLMAGPGVPRSGVVDSTPVGLHDLAPTITTWYGLKPMRRADGVPLFAGRMPRRDILLQGTVESDTDTSYLGLRTRSGYKYLEYRSGGVEIYNLDRDPQELENLAKKNGHQALRAKLAKKLKKLRGCEESRCVSR